MPASAPERKRPRFIQSLIGFAGSSAFPLCFCALWRSKNGGVVRLSKALAIELGEDGIRRSIAVLPGLVAGVIRIRRVLEAGAGSAEWLCRGSRTRRSPASRLKTMVTARQIADQDPVRLLAARATISGPVALGSAAIAVCWSETRDPASPGPALCVAWTACDLTILPPLSTRNARIILRGRDRAGRAFLARQGGVDFRSGIRARCPLPGGVGVVGGPKKHPARGDIERRKAIFSAVSKKAVGRRRPARSLPMVLARTPISRQGCSKVQPFALR